MTASTTCKEISSLLEGFYTLGRALDDYFIQHSKEHVIPQDIKDKFSRLNKKYSPQQLAQEGGMSNLSLQLKKIAMKRGFLDWLSYGEFIQRENFITCSFFRILQIHRTIIMLMKDQNILDIEVLSRVGIELMSKTYMVIQSDSFYKVLSYHDSRKIERIPETLSEKEYSMSPKESAVEDKNNIEKELANDNFYKDNNLDIRDILNKTEKTARDFFYGKIYSKVRFSQIHAAGQSNFVHSNPERLCDSFSGWQTGFFFSFNDPSGTKNFEKFFFKQSLDLASVLG